MSPLHCVINCEVFFTLNVYAVIIPDCSFPFTYNGGLYYRCIENMTGVSTAEQTFACINVNASKVVCDSPGES